MKNKEQLKKHYNDKEIKYLDTIYKSIYIL